MKSKSTSEQNEAKEKATIPGRIKEPPKWVTDPDKCKEAVLKVEAQSKKKQPEFSGKEYMAVTAIYKNKGGKIKGKAKNESFLTSYTVLAALNEILEGRE